MTIEIEVVDLGINNLASLCRGLREAAGVEPRIISNAKETSGADLLVLPGVGAYGAAVGELASRQLDEVVLDHAKSGRPLLGVCLGMQLLGNVSEESPGVTGLGLVPGSVRRLVATGDARVPHMGWNGLCPGGHAEVFPALARPLDFYFVHSFAMVPNDSQDVLVTSSFGDGTFVAGVLRGNVLGVQFHPEKSSRGGAQFLHDVVTWASG